jgi:hypothetical protein
VTARDDGAGALPAHAFHLADAANWPGIQRHGLLSATALIKQAKLRGTAARPFTFHRPDSPVLPTGVRLRDQSPMPPAALARCLDAGLTPADWYDLVNAHVYFWLDDERLTRHRGACAARPQVVVTLDLRALLARHGRRAFLTPFNVGNARRRPAARGRRTFVPLAAWLATRWETEAAAGRPPRGRAHPPAELAIAGGVPDLMDFVVSATPD